MKKNKRNITIGLLVLTIFAIAYIPSLISWIYGTTIDTSRIMNGSIEDSIVTEGIFIRDEEVIQAPFGGRVVSELSEGEKVAANTKVATVLKDSAKGLYDELNAVENNIIELQKERAGNTEVFTEDIAKLDVEIGKKVRLIANEGSLVKSGAYNDDIDKLIKKKVEIMGGLGSSDTFIKNKLDERESLKEQIKQNTREVYANFPGLISYSIDDYEDILRIDSISKLTPSMLEDVKAKGTDIGIQDGRIDADKAFAKIIKGLEYYIVATVDTEYAESMLVDEKIKIRMKDLNKTITGILYYKSNQMNGKYVIAIKTDKNLSDTVKIRKMNIDIIKKSYEGLKVSLKSLKDVDLKDKKGSIFIVKGNYASERGVKIVGKNNEFAIIQSADNSKPVALYDMFVLNPTNIKDGETLKR